MDESTQRKFHTIRALALGDEEYYRLLKENGELEKQYNNVLVTLTPRQQDIIQDFLMSREGLSWRMLEIACSIMRFPTAEEVLEQLCRDGVSQEHHTNCSQFFLNHPE